MAAVEVVKLIFQQFFCSFCQSYIICQLFTFTVSDNFLIFWTALSGICKTLKCNIQNDDISQNEKHLEQNLGIFLILEKFHFSISRHFHFTFHFSKKWIRFLFHFSLLEKSESDFHFTFTSRKKWIKFSFHFSLLEKSETDFHFTFHFSNFQYPLSQDTAIDPAAAPPTFSDFEIYAYIYRKWKWKIFFLINNKIYFDFWWLMTPDWFSQIFL